MAEITYECESCPKWLWSDIEKRASKEGFNSRDGEEAEFSYSDDPEVFKRCERHLFRIKAIEGREGDRSTFFAACSGRDFNISPKNFWPLFKRWNKTNAKPPWDERDLYEKLKGGYKYAKKERGWRNEPLDFPDSLFEEFENQEGKSEKQPLPLNQPRDFVFRFLELYPHLKCVDDQWYLYRDDCWHRLTDSQFSAWFRVTFLSFISAGENPKNRHFKEVVALLKDLLAHRCREDKLETWSDGRSGDYARMRNGILNLGTGALEPHSPNWFSTIQLPFDYDLSAKCSEFKSFLRSIWDGDTEQEDSLQRFLGYMIHGSMTSQKCGLFVGKSRAGKGVLSRLLIELLGRENCFPTSLTMAGERFGLSGAIGKRLMLIADAHKGRGEKADIAFERIKNITGEDPLEIDIKYKQPVAMKLQCKVLIVANDVPRFVDPQGAFAKRTIAFSFSKSFAGREDRGLEERLRKELSGIFNWALEGYRKYQENGRLYTAKKSKQLFRDVVEEMNPLVGFVERRLHLFNIEDPTTFATFSRERLLNDPPQEKCEDLYKTYKEDAETYGHHAMSFKKFCRKVREVLPDYVGEGIVDVPSYSGTISKRLRRRTLTMLCLVQEGEDWSSYPSESERYDESSSNSGEAQENETSEGSLEDEDVGL